MKNMNKKGKSQMVSNTPLFDPKIEKRRKAGEAWKVIFNLSMIIASLFLIILIFTIINNAFGFVALQNEVDVSSIFPGKNTLQECSREELIQAIHNNLSRGLVRRYDREVPLTERSESNLREIIDEKIINSRIVSSWSLVDSLTKQKTIKEFIAKTPGSSVQFRSWITPKFLASPQSSIPEKAGIRSAIMGSLMIILIALVFAFPIGIGAAIYMQEYAKKSSLTRIIQLNIYNLAGIPSIIFGLLGLAVFVRMLEPFTSGAMFGLTSSETANGRTIISAGLTLGLLILPIIIINAQEAIRAVPDSLRNAAFGVGASRWQMIWSHLLPSCIDRILTGTILAVSRAIGETAPMVVVGASTFIALDPSNIFSKFTTLPIQIYQWSARPQGEFRNIAAAAILVLLILLLSMNTFAIIARDKISKKKRLGL